MGISTLKPSGGINDFNLSLTGATTTATLDREYSTGSYSIVSSATDNTLDIYAYNADGSLAGYSNTKSFTATKGFVKMVVIGGTTGDLLSFTYKKTYVTTSQTNEVTAGPFILSTSPSSLPNADDVLTITGGNFAVDVEVHFIGQDNVVYDAKSITRTSATQILVTRPDILSIAQSPYTIRVMNPGVPNPSGSASNVATNAVSAGLTTSWVTNSPLPAFSVGFAYTTTVVATDPESSPITYSLASGSFPTGISLASNGVISGTNTDVTTEGQTFTAVIRATDAGNNFTDRSFTMQANLRPSWTTEAGDLPAAPYGIAYSNQLVASTGSLGGSLTYAIQSGNLFPGLTLSSSGLISGTSTGTLNTTTTFTVRVTDALGAYTDRQFNIFSDLAGQQAFTTSTSWTVPANVTSVSVVAVGAGGGGSASTTALGGFSGGGGAGGALHWRNAISVTPGETLSIGIGAAGTGGTAAGQNNATAGGESFVKRGTTYLVQAPGGEAGKYNLNNTSLGGTPNTALGGGGGNGGRGGNGANGQGQYPLWNWNGTTATATLAAVGGSQTVTFPTNAVVTFDIAGAKGSPNGGGNGGRLQGTFTATAGTYQINVGGQGSNGAGAGGGWNGGGQAGGNRGDEGSGGGATDIRPATDTSLNGRIAVAAGGGGQGGFYGGAGGAGGGTQGNDGTSGQGQGGKGGTSVAGGNGGSPNGGSWGTSGGFGTGGVGGTSSTSGGGGGGAGYYGGGGGGADIDGCCTNGGGGGGGSSYASGAISNVVHTTGYNSGAGYATLSFATATNPNTPDSYPSGGGGGAAGYSGNGGDGSLNATFVATAGAGGGGSGSTGHNAGTETTIVAGGGVGLLGEGTSGAAPAASAAQAGNPGSSGSGKNYGGGGAGADDDSTSVGGTGGPGAVRIIWGSGRQFPATQTGDK